MTALKLKKTPKKEIEKSVREAAEILDITDYLERKPKALSGGQRQRVAIGRAIVRNPQVFLMDEPLSNLDAKLRNQMRTELIKLRKRVDTTFVYVTHDQTEAMTLGDRIVVMKDGVIQQTGTPNECFNCPANLFVAGFLGTPQMNFFEESALIKKSGRYYIAVMGREFELPEKKQAIMERKKLEEQEITVGVRPENIDIILSGEGFTGNVEVSEMLGSEMYLHLATGEKRLVLKVTQPDILNKFASKGKIEEEIAFSINPSEAHLFSKNTGDNLLYE